MRYGNPILSVAESVMSALLKDLPDIEEDFRGKKYTRRPNEDDIEVKLWQQSFPNTALVFDGQTGIAGQAISTADIVVVTYLDTALVYCNGRLAYKANAKNEEFAEDALSTNLRGQREASSRYK